MSNGMVDILEAIGDHLKSLGGSIHYFPPVDIARWRAHLILDTRPDLTGRWWTDLTAEEYRWRFTIEDATLVADHRSKHFALARELRQSLIGPK